MDASTRNGRVPTADASNTSKNSLDHLVRAGKQCWRHLDSDHTRRLGVDDQLESRGLLDRQIGRLRALDYPVKVDDDALRDVVYVRSIGEKRLRAPRRPSRRPREGLPKELSSLRHWTFARAFLVPLRVLVLSEPGFTALSIRAFEICRQLSLHDP
jgi:hypothetical protein